MPTTIELNYGRPSASPDQRLVIAVRLGGMAVVLFAVSTYVVLLGAGEEPYFSFAWSQAVVQVGVAGLLLAGWAAWAAVLVRHVCQGRLPRASSVAVLIAAVAAFYLVAGIVGYVNDLQHSTANLRSLLQGPTTMPAATQPGVSVTP